MLEANFDWGNLRAVIMADTTDNVETAVTFRECGRCFRHGFQDLKSNEL